MKEIIMTVKRADQKHDNAEKMGWQMGNIHTFTRQAIKIIAEETEHEERFLLSIFASAIQFESENFGSEAYEKIDWNCIKKIIGKVKEKEGEQI